MNTERNAFWLTWLFQGDSGGPLTVVQDGVHILEGVTSHGLSKENHVKVGF